MTDSVRRFDADFKATPGQLSLTATHIAWVPKVAGAMDKQQQNMARVINMLASKPGKPKVSLKLLFKDDVPPGGLLFTFSGASKDDDRKAVQDILIPFVSASKGITAAAPPAAASTPQAGPSTGAAAVVSAIGAGEGATPGSGPGTPGTPSSGPVNKRRRIDDASASTPGTPLTEQQKVARKAENRLKFKVLSKDPILKELHKKLVMGNVITEKEFWDGRQHKLEAEALAQSLKPGRPSRLLDDRFDLDPSKSKSGSSGGGTGVGVKQKETGPMVLNITKELTREIFEEFPVVQDAYARHVPGISEAEFWTRYFTSQLWEQHRASGRSTGNTDASRKKDDIFDAYLEEPDWNAAPRRDAAADGVVGRLIDLAATEEDHGDSDTIRDVTMQPGRQRSSLPLMRRFNEHSNKLLRRSGEAPKSSLTSSILAEDMDLYNEIDLEDLHAPAPDMTIALDVRDSDGAGTGDEVTVKGVMPGRDEGELRELAQKEAQEVAEWHLDFSGVSLANPREGAENLDLESPEVQLALERFAEQRATQKAALGVVKELHQATNAENAVNPPFPPEILSQMISCNNVATEFLRLYWSAVLPPRTTAGAVSDAQSEAAARAAKAERMAGFLRSTEERVEAVVQTAQLAGVDPARVQAAMAPTIGAVAVALQREQKRLVGKKGVGTNGTR